MHVSRLSDQNRARAALWHPGYPFDRNWNLADWSNALCGEAGEAANLVKKIRRHETGFGGTKTVEELRGRVAKEIADTVIYADLLAGKLHLDLEDLLIDKFNEISKKKGFDIWLP